MRLLFRYLVVPYRRLLSVVLVAMLVETAASLAEPWPLKIVLDNVVGKHHLPVWLANVIAHVLGGTDRAHIAFAAALAVVGIAAIAGAASYLDNYVTEIVAQLVAHQLRLKTYAHLQRLSLAYYNKHQVGGLISTLTTDIGTIQDFASSDVLTILVDLFTVVGIFGLMFWLRWDFAVIAAMAAPFLLLFVLRFRTAVKRATRDVRSKQSELVAIELQGLQAQQVVQAFGAERVEEERLRGASQTTMDSALKARRTKSLVSPVTALVVSACTAIVLWRGADLTLNGLMTAGVLTVFLSYLAKFFKPVRDLAKMTTAIAQTNVAAERIRDIMHTDDGIVDRPGARPANSIRGELVFDHVGFGYDPATPVLHDVSFAVDPGHLVGIVGTTGGGKSTVLSLIPRFYDPAEGRILIDGVDVRDYTVETLRQNVTMVLQDTVLFRGTIHENIAYGCTNASFDDVVNAAKLADAHEFIIAMPNGYDTLVGERGLTLSGGQRQRIGIARAVIRNTPILLLDEPTAALDNETEDTVIEALERAMRGRTVIMISHRLNTLRGASSILVLSDGRIVEQGNHDQLMQRQGVYADLFQTQMGEEPIPIRA
jgi:ABC-type multidrug transport system fused ATPase/permease subunit